MNSVNIIGNLTRDPELRATQGGVQIATFSIAVNKKWVTKDGEKKDEVSYFDCKAFARRAEVIHQYFRKGSKIALSGELRQERWETKEGDKRSNVVIAVNEFTFVDSNGGGGKQQPAPSYAGSADDDCPF